MTGIKQGCAREYTVLLRIYMFMFAFIAACAAAVFFVGGVKAGVAAAAVVSVILCVMGAAAPLSSGRISYSRRGGCLFIERGLIVRRTIVVNRSEVQCAEISSGFMQRRLGLCTVTFSARSGRFRLKGLSEEDGKRLKYLFGGEAAD